MTHYLSLIHIYGSIGKERLNQIIARLNTKGVYECWLRKDGICNIRTPKGYRRVGSLPEYPGEEAEDICLSLIHIYAVRKMFRHPLYPFMVSDVDFFVEKDGKIWIVECKTSFGFKKDEWDNDSCLLYTSDTGP